MRKPTDHFPDAGKMQRALSNIRRLLAKRLARGDTLHEAVSATLHGHLVVAAMAGLPMDERKRRGRGGREAGDRKPAAEKQTRARAIHNTALDQQPPQAEQ